MNLWKHDHLVLYCKPRTLSGQRIKLLSLLHHYLEAQGYAPTVRELAKSMSFNSHSSVYAHLDVLRQGGFLACHPGRARTWRVTMKGRQLVEKMAC